MLMKVRADQVPYSGLALKRGLLALSLILSLTGLGGCGMDINGELPDSASRNRGAPRGDSGNPGKPESGPNTANQPISPSWGGDIESDEPSDTEELPGDFEEDTPAPEPTAAATASPEPTAAATASPEPTAAATASPEPTATATASPEPTAAATASPEPSASPSSEPSSEPSPSPSSSADSDVPEEDEPDHEGDGTGDDEESDESDSCEDSADRSHGRPRKPKLHKKNAATRVLAVTGALGYIIATTGDRGVRVEHHYRCAPNRSFYRKETLLWSLAIEPGCAAERDPTSILASLSCDDGSAPSFSHIIRLRARDLPDITAVRAIRTLREILSEPKFQAPQEYDLIDDTGVQVGALYRERVRSGDVLVEREHYRLLPGYEAPGTDAPITLSKRAWSGTAPNLRQFLRRYMDVKGTFMSTSPFVRD